ncbi:UDP-N-acetylmuramate dehydrogenase [Mesorhizobium delmotii]|uniref:UDP-N-acetylenolpyruvoylglucosamine reductase n=1 Tax=Mesorhizobium delmotii TaxID=1631247 RepID=A0A2P9AVA5_9HYPH|nr:UDP-N-acetylmuramate dehydrogenase [Mesorhizobium delmotii]SJM35137.1 UDP-N-acetylenolpyruvoylglucosamine reductase [Mesorhizobium delmotii]
MPLKSAPFGTFDATRLVENAPLSAFTTWRVGGAARWLLHARADELPFVFDACHRRGIPVYKLGAGSNLLVSDSGLPGLVVCFRRTLQKIWFHEDQITAEAGALMPRLARTAARNGCAGFEFLAGIPGTVGGGVALNCGTEASEQRELKLVLKAVDVVDDRGREQRIDDIRHLGMSYRTTRIAEYGLTVLRAMFRPDIRGDPGLISLRMGHHLDERRRKQPIRAKTAGSTFKRVPGGLPAAWYIEQCNLKGLAIGGARISPKHANWIENCGSATSADIEALIETVQGKVEARFGIVLEPEIHWLGNRPPLFRF